MAAELAQNVSQKQLLQPTLLHAAKILQMDCAELQTYLRELAYENVALEYEPPASLDRVPVRAGARGISYDDGRFAAAPGTTLQEDLLLQAENLRLAPRERRLLAGVIRQLDPDGYLRQSVQELAQALGADVRAVRRAAAQLKTLEPAGVGAATAQECLLLQLARLQPENRTARRMVETCLPEIVRGRPPAALAKRLGVGAAEAAAALELIRTLHPKPANGYDTQAQTVYLLPDVEIVETPEGFACRFLSGQLPTLRLSRTYEQMLRQTDDPEVRRYLAQQKARAQEQIFYLEQRRSTIMRLMELAVARQQAFFRDGAGALQPFPAVQAAQTLGLHPSTVSRAIRSKYMRCRFGTLPVQVLFCRSAGADGVSQDALKAELARLIRDEPPQRPLSDAQLAACLAEKGMQISRRTVAAYRKQLRLPGAYDRRRPG